MIFHIADRDRWIASADQGEYTASTLGRELADEGFIHMSTAQQVSGVVARFYRGLPNLVLLHVDEQRLTSPLIVEQLGDAPEAFPHLYGPLNLDAVVAVDDPLQSPSPPQPGRSSRGVRTGRRAATP